MATSRTVHSRKIARAAHTHDAPKKPMPLYGSRTDIGLVRDHNEDSLVVQPPLFAVADGMGGHAAGEVASEIAVQTLAEFTPDTADGDELARAIIKANRAVIEAALDGRGSAGMGTTVTAAIVDGERLAIGQVGDSRAYLLHAGCLQRITRDHSLMAEYIESGRITEEEARSHPERSIITRALGSDPNTLPDIYDMNVSAGDRLLLCSDGLSGMIRDSEIEHTLATVRDPQKCAGILVRQAIDAGGNDNITAIVVDITGSSEARARRERFKMRAGALFLAAALLLVLAASCFGFYAYAHNSAYIKSDDGRVAVYRGIPGEFLGLTISSQVEVCDMEAADAPAGVRDELEGEGLRVDSVDEAFRLIAAWEAQAADDGAAAQSESAETQGDSGADAQDAEGGDAA